MLATVDIERLGREIVESAKRTRETSPEFLQQRIAELERAGKSNGTADAGAELAELRSEVSRLKPLVAFVRHLETELAKSVKQRQELVAALRGVLGRFENGDAPKTGARSANAAPVSLDPLPTSESVLRKRATEHGKVERGTSLSSPATVATPHDGLTSSEQKVLDALASLEAVGVELRRSLSWRLLPDTRIPRAGALPDLRLRCFVKGWIESSGGKASLTGDGREAANKPDRPATTKELQERIFALLGEGERRLLMLLIESYPDTLRRVELAEKAGYSNAKSGGFAAPLARLIELGFAEAVSNGIVRGSEMLFLKRRAGVRR